MNIGILGTARIVKNAIVTPAKLIPGCDVYAIASRDFKRATQYGRKNAIAVIHKTYDALIQDENVDLIYCPLPNTLHFEYVIKALTHGKHVLCEKPIALNQTQAIAMYDCADKNGKALIEAFHYRYHPIIKRLKEIVDSSKLGAISAIESKLHFYFPRNDIRFNYSLGGGTILDTGCYLFDMCKYLFPGPYVLKDSNIKPWNKNIDLSAIMNISANNVPIHLSCSLDSPLPWNFKSYIKIYGEKGKLSVYNPFAPQLGNMMLLKTKDRTQFEFHTRQTTYYYQLLAITHMFNQKNLKSLMFPKSSIETMHLIEEAYLKAGMIIRT